MRHVPEHTRLGGELRGERSPLIRKESSSVGHVRGEGIQLVSEEDGDPAGESFEAPLDPLIGCWVFHTGRFIDPLLPATTFMDAEEEDSDSLGFE